MDSLDKAAALRLRRPACHCDAHAAAATFGPEMAAWARRHGFGADDSVMTALTAAFLERTFRVTECAICITPHGAEDHRCSDIQPACLVAAREAGRLRRLETHTVAQCSDDCRQAIHIIPKTEVFRDDVSRD
jgi:hypothetical protein